MSNMPSVSGKDAIKAFKRLGFYLKRTNGSHHVLARDGHEHILTVPVHGNQSLKKGTLLGLIKASEFTIEEFLEALK